MLASLFPDRLVHKRRDKPVGCLTERLQHRQKPKSPAMQCKGAVQVGKGGERMQFDRLLFRISALTEHLTATHFQAVDVGVK